MKPVQCRSLIALARSVTCARQVYAPFLFVQSRCPTKLIDDGRKSRIGGIETGEVGVGCGACVTTGVGLGVDVDCDVGVTVGVTTVAVAVGAEVGTVVGMTRCVCPVAADPHAARAKTAIAILQKMSTKRFLFLFIIDDNGRANGSRNLRWCIVFGIYLPDRKTNLNSFSEQHCIYTQVLTFEVTRENSYYSPDLSRAGCGRYPHRYRR